MTTELNQISAHALTLARTLDHPHQVRQLLGVGQRRRGRGARLRRLPSARDVGKVRRAPLQLVQTRGGVLELLRSPAGSGEFAFEIIELLQSFERLAEREQFALAVA